MEKGYCYDEADFYGVDIHPRAKEVANYEFFHAVKFSLL